MPYYMHDINPDPYPAMALIQHLSTSELKEVLNNESKIEELIKNLQQVKNAESEKEMVVVSNKSLAEFNLSQQPELDKLCRQLSEMYREAKELKDEAEENKQKLDEASKQISLDTTLALLQTLSAQTEEDTEKLAETFLDGDLTVEAFLDEFSEKRKLSHLRRIKSEKMAELLRQISSNQTVNPPSRPPAPARRPAPPPPQHLPPPMQPHFQPFVNVPYSVQTPYPIGPTMPMPLPQYR